MCTRRGTASRRLASARRRRRSDSVGTERSFEVHWNIAQPPSRIMIRFLPVRLPQSKVQGVSSSRCQRLKLQTPMTSKRDYLLHISLYQKRKTFHDARGTFSESRNGLKVPTCRYTPPSHKIRPKSLLLEAANLLTLRAAPTAAQPSITTTA